MDIQHDERLISFQLGGMMFEYDSEKNKKNIEKHGISFESAARVFFDYDRIEMYDEGNSIEEDRFQTIGDLSAGEVIIGLQDTDIVIGNIGNLVNGGDDVIFVVYTERKKSLKEVTRIISARYATNFERGLYYGKY